MKAFQFLYVLCFTRLRNQVSVYRTTGPLVIVIIIIKLFQFIKKEKERKIQWKRHQTMLTLSREATEMCIVLKQIAAFVKD